MHFSQIASKIENEPSSLPWIDQVINLYLQGFGGFLCSKSGRMISAQKFSETLDTLSDISSSSSSNSSDDDMVTSTGPLHKYVHHKPSPWSATQFSSTTTKPLRTSREITSEKVSCFLQLCNLAIPTVVVANKRPQPPSQMKDKPKLLKYWTRRYDLFERFDCGIQLDEGKFELVLSALLSVRCGTEPLLFEEVPTYNSLTLIECVHVMFTRITSDAAIDAPS